MLRQILIAGDSTVTNRGYSEDYESGICYTGWGQMLSLYVGINYRVINFAKSGLTTDTFRSEGHYNLLLKELNEGDYVLFQFGHNDQKLKELHYNLRYRENLITYINEIRQKGAIPVLVTPLARNTWNCVNGEYNDLLFDYAKSVRDICEEYNVQLVDLHGFAKEWIIENGRDGVRPFFYPSDYTHTNDYGAFFFAKYVYEQIKDFIKPKAEIFDWKSFCPSNIPQFLYQESELYLTIEEALRVVRIVGIFFTKIEEIPSNRNPEIICAEQNGYNILGNKIEKYIRREDFIKLFKLAVLRNIEIDSILGKESSEYIKRKDVLVYLEEYEDKMNYAKNKKKHKIEGC